MHRAGEMGARREDGIAMHLLIDDIINLRGATWKITPRGETDITSLSTIHQSSARRLHVRDG